MRSYLGTEVEDVPVELLPCVPSVCVVLLAGEVPELIGVVVEEGDVEVVPVLVPVLEVPVVVVVLEGVDVIVDGEEPIELGVASMLLGVVRPAVPQGLVEPGVIAFEPALVAAEVLAVLPVPQGVEVVPRVPEPVLPVVFCPTPVLDVPVPEFVEVLPSPELEVEGVGDEVPVAGVPTELVPVVVEVEPLNPPVVLPGV